MKSILFGLAILIAFQTRSQSNDETAVRQVLQEQAIAWNQGNIDGFMKGYWQNDSLMFVGRGGITYGWTNTLNNYKKGYPDTAAMGKLTFTIINTTGLSAEYFHVTGKWHLQRRVGNVEGYFTLLFRKMNGKWLIIADHTS